MLYMCMEHDQLSVITVIAACDPLFANLGMPLDAVQSVG